MARYECKQSENNHWWVFPLGKAIEANRHAMKKVILKKYYSFFRVWFC
jgi:hypothetical protein